MRLLMLAIFLCLLSGPLIGLQAWNILASLTVLVFSSILLLIGIYVWRRGLRYGSYYVLAWGALLAESGPTKISVGISPYAPYV